MKEKTRRTLGVTVEENGVQTSYEISEVATGVIVDDDKDTYTYNSIAEAFAEIGSGLK